MKELTSISIWAESSLVELRARFCFKVRRQVLFLHQFMFSMSKGTLIFKNALASQLPVSAHLRLAFHLILLDKVLSFSVIIKMLLRFFDSSHFIGLIIIFWGFTRRLLMFRTRIFGSLKVGCYFICWTVFIVPNLSWTVRLIIEWSLPWSLLTLFWFWNSK